MISNPKFEYRNPKQAKMFQLEKYHFDLLQLYMFRMNKYLEFEPGAVYN